MILIDKSTHPLLHVHYILTPNFVYTFHQLLSCIGFILYFANIMCPNLGLHHIIDVHFRLGKWLDDMSSEKK